MNISEEEIKKNIAKLKEKVGEKRMGGKGSERIRQKHTSKSTDDDKLVKNVIKKLGVQQFPGMDQVNMFKDDNTVLHFNSPQVHLNIQSNIVVVSGNSETKSCKDLFPQILTQLGPKQMHLLQDFIKSSSGKEQEAPDLVNANFEETAKVD